MQRVIITLIEDSCQLSVYSSNIQVGKAIKRQGGCKDEGNDDLPSM